MNTNSKRYNQKQTAIVMADLLEASCWFCVLPLACGVFEVTVKAERDLPEPLGPTGTGALVSFNEWLEDVERHFGAPVDDSTRTVFRDYFSRGLTPGEAIETDRTESLECD